MGILNLLKTKRFQENAARYITARSGKAGVISPWSEGQLQKVVWADLFGLTNNPITRAEAMSTPGVAAGRSRIIEEISPRPLRASRDGQLLDPQPTWLSNTKSGVPPQFRIAHTLDDLIFYGQSLWEVRRDPETDRILDAWRIDYDRWDINEDYLITVDDEVAPASQVIYFQSMQDALLTQAERTIRTSILLEQTVADRASVPLPMIIMQEREGSDLTEEEAQQYVEAVAEARRNPSGAVMFIPATMEAKIEGDVQVDLLTEGRNSAKLDIADFLNLPSGAIDAALPKASLNYETEETTQQELRRRLKLWTTPIEARLSMDDITPPGTVISFDFSENPRHPGGDIGPYRED